jgi:cysteine desulfurase
VIFTSGATEANNLLIAGISPEMRKRGRPKLIAPATEHKCVLESARNQTKFGSEFTELPVDKWGNVSLPTDFDFSKVGLMSCMAANNEIGSLSAINTRAFAAAKSAGVLLHTDAAQLIGRKPCREILAHFDAVSLSAHKLGGIPGIGALLIKRPWRLALEPTIHGGGQQGGLRSGTLPVPLAYSFAIAAKTAEARSHDEENRLEQLCRIFLNRLEQNKTAYTLRGPGLHERLPGNLNITFHGVDAMALAVTLEGEVSFSLGAACQTRSFIPSHVLQAIGLNNDEISETIRIGFGWTSTEDEALTAANIFSGAVLNLSKL